jgi:protoporphyrinogen/coproporphyrinogen III oxidase
VRSRRGPRADEDVASYLSRRFGRALYRDLLGPLFGGLYASDPADMLVRHALAPLLRQLGVERSVLPALLGRRMAGAANAPACSFRGGMSTLTDAMHERVRAHVRLGAPLRSLRLEDEGRVALETPSGMILADRVVLTIPAYAAATLLAHVAPDAAARLAALRYNRVAIVHLRGSATLHGMGYQVGFGEPLATRGVTFNHALFGRDRVYTAFLGGPRAPGLIEMSDDAIGRIAAREFREVTGADARVHALMRTEIPAWDRSWTAVDGLELPPQIRIAANYVSRAGIPGRLVEARLFDRSRKKLVVRGGMHRSAQPAPAPGVSAWRAHAVVSVARSTCDWRRSNTPAA